MECNSSGLQMLMERWRLQEEKLQEFEKSLEEDNKSFLYKPILSDAKKSDEETELRQSISNSPHFNDANLEDEINSKNCVKYHDSHEDKTGDALWKGDSCLDKIFTSKYEPIRVFEKKTCRDNLKNGINHNTINEIHTHVPNCAMTSSMENVQKVNSEITNLQLVDDPKYHLQAKKNSGNYICQNVMRQNVESPTTRSNDDLTTSSPDVMLQNSSFTCLEDGNMFHKAPCSPQTKVSIHMPNFHESKDLLVKGKGVECSDMAVNLVSLMESQSIPVNCQKEAPILLRMS